MSLQSDPTSKKCVVEVNVSLAYISFAALFVFPLLLFNGFFSTRVGSPQVHTLIHLESALPFPVNQPAPCFTLSYVHARTRTAVNLWPPPLADTHAHARSLGHQLVLSLLHLKTMCAAAFSVWLSSLRMSSNSRADADLILSLECHFSISFLCILQSLVVNLFVASISLNFKPASVCILLKEQRGGIIARISSVDNSMICRLSEPPGSPPAPSRIG